MRKHILSHVDSCRVTTVESKYIRLSPCWSRVFVSTRKIGISQFCIVLYTWFWATWYGSDRLKYGIKHFSDGKLNVEVSGMIHSCPSCHGVLDQLRVVLIQLPVMWLLASFWPQDPCRVLQITFQTSLRTYSSLWTVWTHQIQNFRHHLA